MSPFIQNLLKDQITEKDYAHYHTIHQTIGWLGMTLPFVLWGGSVWFSGCDSVQSSVGHYYFNNMREAFVGVLWVFALFLYTYKGYSKLDNILTNVAGLCSLCISIFPTTISGASPCQFSVATVFDYSNHTTVHFISAASFFAILSVVSFFIFTRSKYDAPQQRTLQKRIRNRVYRTCGVVIIICLLILLVQFLSRDGDQSGIAVYVLETIMLLAFGFSWITKGEAIWLLRDRDQASDQPLTVSQTS